jgi:hypothetical protein
VTSFLIIYGAQLVDQFGPMRNRLSFRKFFVEHLARPRTRFGNGCGSSDQRRMTWPIDQARSTASCDRNNCKRKQRRISLWQ